MSVGPQGELHRRRNAADRALRLQHVTEIDEDDPSLVYFTVYVRHGAVSSPGLRFTFEPIRTDRRQRDPHLPVSPVLVRVRVKLVRPLTDPL